MPGKLMAGWLAVVLAISTTGCCRWCQRRCCPQAGYQPAPMSYQAAPVCCQPAPVCCPAPAPACCPAPAAPACCPATSSYQSYQPYQPVSTAPQPQWQRNYGTPMTCYCN